jgi:signal transduction histidine kinase
MILIVDDKHENLYSLKTLLQLHAYEVDTATSGEEALRKILKNEYALIILDVQMPEMDGYEVAETITGYSKTKNIPIIFLSAVNIDKRFITRGYASGGVDYVTKPFDPDLLMLKVKTFVRLHLQTQELKRIQETLKEEIENRKQAQRAVEEVNSALEEKVKERTIELLQSNKDLEASNAELQQYAFVASHDLQEPLRKIITFSNILWERYLSGNTEAERYMKKITASSMTMRNLINDLLNYSRLSSDHHFTPTSLKDIIQETLSDLEISIAEKQADVEIGELPKAEVIPSQFKQVFQNLISNSLKFSKKDISPVITIRSELTDEKSLYSPPDQNGQYVRIYVTDNGIGFKEEFLEKMFTIFQRLHLRGEYEGTGIGLAIVKKIIEKHHGIISATGREGEGATFIIIIPLHQAAVAPSNLHT